MPKLYLIDFGNAKLNIEVKEDAYFEINKINTCLAKMKFEKDDCDFFIRKENLFPNIFKIFLCELI